MKNISLCKGSTAFWYLILFGFSLSYTPVQANKILRQAQSSPQQHQISGIITDGTSPLPGVTISIKGKATPGTISDFNGQYTLSASPTDVLLFTFMGFKTATELIDGRKTININLQEDITSLQEVRVNAGYYSVKEKERTGSIAKVSAKDIGKQPVSNPLAAIQGRMTGVNITQETGAPGGGFSIQIRGINSIRSDGNQPLYIVNGMPYSTLSLGSTSLISGIMPSINNPLNAINPADIESIEVLKDADATAIYGSRGANGVVLITTKKGRQGKTQFVLQTYTSIGKITRKMELMNTQQYLSMRQEALTNDKIQNIPTTAPDINGTWDKNKYTDWQNKLIGGTSLVQNFQASMTGGNEQTNFLLSGTFRNETTVFPGDNNYKKGIISSNLNHQSDSKKFILSFAANYSTDKNVLPGVDLTRYAYTLAPNAPDLYQQDGTLNWENGTFDNPLGFLNGKYHTQTNNLLSNAILRFKLTSNLELKANLGYTDNRIIENRIIPTTVYNPFDNIGNDAATLYLNQSNRQSWIAEPQLNWDSKWDKMVLNILIGTTFQSDLTQQLVQSGSGFTSNALINNLGAASTRTLLSHQETRYKYNALFGRLNINWNEKYILNITGRRDGSSRFGPGNHFANFGAIGMAWLFSNESFFKNKTGLSFGKLRGSLGTTGNDQIGDYQFLDTYTVTANNYQGMIGLQPARLFNPNFGWETNKKIELALELGFFNDNIFLNTAYYRNRSSNQLVGVPLAATTGFSSIQDNFDATVQNTGFEIEIRTLNYKTENFKWTTSLNFTKAKNELIEFKNLEGSTYANTLVVGQPLSISKLYKLVGIDTQTKVYQFKNYDSDGQITSPNDRQWVASLNPQWFGGLANQISFKNWELDFLFQFVKQQGRNFANFFPVPGSFSNQPTSILEHQSTGESSATTQLYTSGANPLAIQAYSRYAYSDATISDASFIRLKSINLSYNIPTQWAKNSSGRIYLQGQNLLTFTKYKGADPENQTTGYLPPLKQWTLGIQFNL